MNSAERLRSQTTLPIIVAPMFLISGIELVVTCCKEGFIGTFPALNARTIDDFESMLVTIGDQLAAAQAQNPQGVVAPYGVNLILHRSNPRVDADLELCVKHRVPLIITSLGKPAAAVESVHGYGGLVFADVITVEFARKAAAAGVDGLILVCAGAGGHAGILNPLAFVPAVRDFFDGAIAVAGCISDGRAVRACEALGADFAYMGTRFIPTLECEATPAYKDMIVAAQASDIIYTSAVSGVHANFIRASLERCGYAIESQGTVKADLDLSKEYTLWRDIWTAGQGVQNIHDIDPVAVLAQRLRAEYNGAP